MKYAGRPLSRLAFVCDGMLLVRLDMVKPSGWGVDTTCAFGNADQVLADKRFTAQSSPAGNGGRGAAGLTAVTQ